MALCVRRLRCSPGLGGRWKSGVRGAGGAAGRLREGSRVRDVILFRDLRPQPGFSTPSRRPIPPTALILSPSTKPLGIRLSSPTSGHCPALQPLKDIEIKLSSEAASQFLQSTEPSDIFSPGREGGYLSSTQLDCFRGLFEPGVCRTPYQALVFSTPAAHEGLLEFTLSAKNAGSQTSGSNRPNMEEHLAVMYEKLREELPMFLFKWRSFSIYKKDVEFVSSTFHLRIRGLIKYQLFLVFVRILLLSFYMNPTVSVWKLTSHPETNSIHARWSFSGLPIYSVLHYLFKTDKEELYRTFHAFSTFQLAPDGLICQHKLERMMPSPPITVTKKSVLARALLALGLWQDRPALNFLSTPKMHPEL